MRDGFYFTPQKDTNAKLHVVEDGKQLPFLIADSRVAKRCLALARIENELMQAVLLAKMIDPSQQGHVNLAFWHAAVMSYARCFSNAWGRGTTLEKEHVGQAGSEFLTTHDDIMELRNQYVAHAGNHSQEIDRIAVTLKPPPMPKAVNNTFYFLISQMGPKSENRDDFVRLCDSLISVVTSIRVRAEKRLLDAYRELDLDELYRTAYT